MQFVSNVLCAKQDMYYVYEINMKKHFSFFAFISTVNDVAMKTRVAQGIVPFTTNKRPNRCVRFI